MSVSVMLFPEASEEPCTKCFTPGPTWKLSLAQGDNTDTVGPYCKDCLVSVGSHVFILEEVKIKPKHKPKVLKRRSRKQEMQIMSGIGGRVQPNSGSRPGYKSDGRLYDQVRMEAKYTTKKTFPLERADLNKVRGECQGHEKPVLVVDFKDKLTGKTEDRWAVIEYKEWEKIVHAANKDS